LRAIQLTCVFMPLMVVYPLTFISVRLRSLWYKLLLFGKNYFILFRFTLVKSDGIWAE
jgi:hypothetical protein